MVMILVVLTPGIPPLFAQQADRFAEIGNKAAATRTQLLVNPVPPPLPDKVLPLDQQAGQGFAPMDRMDTQEELQAALVQVRKRYAPFMRQLAPALVSKRARMVLERFDWRVGTAEDDRNFLSVLQGAGQWQPVTIPHYGPPLGKATTLYRTRFTLSNELRSKEAIFIAFKAVDYKAHVFVNGAYVGSHEGAFAPFEFDITRVVHDGENSLLVKVENDYPMGGHVGDDGRKFDGDKVYAATGLGYDDPQLGWHHCPPGMGIWQEVAIEGRARLHFNDVFIRPLGDSDSAEVWLEINSTEVSAREISIRHSLFGQNFSNNVYVGAIYRPETVQVPGVGDLAKPTDWERKILRMGKGLNYLRFRIAVPGAKRWHPEHPWLYQLQVELLDEKGRVADTRKQHFGMRSFRMDTLATPKGAMYLNGRFIRLRGANTMGSFMQNVMRQNWKQLTDDILLAKIANMNYIRMTQFPVQPEVYDYCDMLGMMTQTDLPLFGVLRRNKWAECIRQTEEMERLVRTHPCNIMVSYINERFPNAEGNPHRHFSEYEEFAGFFRAADEAVKLANPDRVIKPGDGDYDPPSPGLPDNHIYNGWYNGHGLGLGEMYKGYWLPVKPGWYYACGEFGSEGLDFYNTMQEFYPAGWLPGNKEQEKRWTPNVIPMAQTFRFHYMWFNRQHTVQDWISASQAHQARITRLTTESFRRNNSLVSFAIHLFIDAWPAGWMKSIMDVKRQAKPAYFEYAHALAPLAVSLRSDRHQVFAGEQMAVEAWLSDDGQEVPAGAKLRYQWEMGRRVLGGGTASAQIVPDSSQFQGYIRLQAPSVKKRSEVILRLQLVLPNGTPVHETDFTISIHPVAPVLRKQVWLAGNQHAPAAKLVEELGLHLVQDAARADVLLIDSIAAYTAQQEYIDQLVKQGKTAIFLQPAPGNYVLGGDTVRIAATTMGKYYFVSPVADHPDMKLFGPDDFWFWFNRQRGLVSPILGEMSQMPGWTPLLTTGQTAWVGANDYANAAAEKKMGKGIYRICHLQLRGRTLDNPAARQFAHLLFD